MAETTFDALINGMNKVLGFCAGVVKKLLVSVFVLIGQILRIAMIGEK